MVQGYGTSDQSIICALFVLTLQVVLLVPRSRLIIFLFSSLAKNSIWDTSRKEEPSKDTIARGFAYLEKTYEQQPESRARNDLTSACNLLISKSILAAKSDLMYPWKASLSLALSAGAVLKDVALFNLAVGHIDEEVDPIVHQKPEKLDPLVFGKIAALLLTSGLSPIHTSCVQYHMA
jgi:hypothetical protein